MYCQNQYSVSELQYPVPMEIDSQGFVPIPSNIYLNSLNQWVYRDQQYNMNQYNMNQYNMNQQNVNQQNVNQQNVNQQNVNQQNVNQQNVNQHNINQQHNNIDVCICKCILSTRKNQNMQKNQPNVYGTIHLQEIYDSYNNILSDPSKRLPIGRFLTSLINNGLVVRINDNTFSIN
jgi:hypothetical protein